MHINQTIQAATIRYYFQERTFEIRFSDIISKERTTPKKKKRIKILWGNNKYEQCDIG